MLGALALAACVALGLGTSAYAQDYPNRSVRIVIAFSPGGTIDVLGRILAQKLTEAWGQTVLVENRAGGSGNIGAVAAAQAAPDGYTLHLGAQSLAVNVTLSPLAGFDPVQDFEPIMLVAGAQDILLVPPNSPFKSVKDARRLRQGPSGQADLRHHQQRVEQSSRDGAAEQADRHPDAAGALHPVVAHGHRPDGGAHRPSVPDHRRPCRQRHVRPRARACGLGPRPRAASCPMCRRLLESGIKFDEEASWYALFAPKGTPKDIVAKINRDMERILALPDMKEREANLGFRMIGGPPERLSDIPQAGNHQMGRGREQPAIQVRWEVERLGMTLPSLARHRRRRALRLCRHSCERLGAELSGTVGQDHHRVFCRRHGRHAWTHRRAEAERALGSVGGGRESRRRWRQHRRGGGGASRARRLHAAFRRAIARGQRVARAGPGLRSGARLRADHAGGERAGHPDGAAELAVQDAEGAGRPRQGQSERR